MRITAGEINRAESNMLEVEEWMDKLRARLAEDLHPAPISMLPSATRDSWKTFAINAKGLRDCLTSMIDAIHGH